MINFHRSENPAAKLYLVVEVKNFALGLRCGNRSF